MSHRFTSWPADRYFPRQLQLLQLALEDLHRAASPGSSSIGTIGRGSRNEGNEPPGTLDPGQRRCRRKLDKTLALLERVASECEMAITGPSEYHLPGRGRCPGCGRGQRISARFCDGCGTSLPRRVDTA